MLVVFSMVKNCVFGQNSETAGSESNPINPENQIQNPGARDPEPDIPKPNSKPGNANPGGSHSSNKSTQASKKRR